MASASKTFAVRTGVVLGLLVVVAMMLVAGRTPAPASRLSPNPAPATKGPGPASFGPADAGAPPPSVRRLTDEMRENLTGLDRLFSEKELAFHHWGTLARAAEALDDYRADRMLGIAKLQRVLRDMDPSLIKKIYAMFRQKLPPEQVEGVGAYRILFRTWGLLDGPAAVATAMKELPENLVRLEAGREAMQSWARENPAAAAKGVASLPDTYGKDYLVYALPDTYIPVAPDAAMAWADALPPDLRHNTLLHCMIKWLQVDPRAATAYATALAGRPGAVDDGNGIVFSRTAGTLARDNVEVAVRWVEQLPADGKARQQAALGLIDWWGMNDPAKAEAWLKRFEPSPVLDPAVNSYARDAAHWAPAVAAAWARTITDPALRNDCMGAVLSAWADQNTEEAVRWAMANGYTAALEPAR